MPNNQSGVKRMDTDFGRKESLVAREGGGWRESVGSIAGALSLAPCGGAGKFIITEDWSGIEAQCHLEGDLAHQALDALGRNVSVFGRKLTSADSGSKRVWGWSMQLLPRQEDIPPLKSFGGIAPNMTGGLPSEVYVKRRWSCA